MKIVGHFLPAPLRRLRTLCQEKEWKEDRISIFNIAFSFSYFCSIWNGSQSFLLFSLPQARELIKKFTRLNSKGHLDILFELILANLCDMHLLAPLWCISLTISKANNLLNCSFKISSCITKMLKKKNNFQTLIRFFFHFLTFRIFTQSTIKTYNIAFRLQKL